MKAPEPIAVYFRVTGALFALLALTVGLAFVDMGPLNIVVAMTIAFVKALLVVLFFMHVKSADGVTRAAACAGLLWLLVMVILTLSDFLTRT
ncbi:MAG TPA: cytochrome C oxidase subunit IV family protein [Bacteroidota bacterium]|nr:cytochrome C oxidase subunit IV family protein [Bacteroidota bacterium]